MGRLFRGKSQELCEMEAVNQAGALPGDTVRAEIDAGAPLSAYSLAYGVPLAGFLVGVIAGAALARSVKRYETLFIGLFGLLGLAAGFGVTLWKGRRFGATVVITGVIQKAL
jgi:positive regulator of sigma E activity